jgi:hypothetical protein
MKRQIILAERDDQNMWSSTHVFLVLTLNEDGGLFLHQGSYEYLAEACQYFDDDVDEFVLPKEINGKKVVGVEEGYVIGGSIEGGLDFLEVRSCGANQISDWLRERSWGDKIDAESVLWRIKDLEKDEKFNL